MLTVANRSEAAREDMLLNWMPPETKLTAVAPVATIPTIVKEVVACRDDHQADSFSRAPTMGRCFFGLSVTISTGLQFLVEPDHRAGFCARAAA